MTVLIDGDIVAYRSAAAAENEDFGICAYYMNNTIDEIMKGTGDTEFKIYISGANNFRYDVYPEYKANRDKQQPPRHRQAAKNYLIEKFGAEVSEGCEADDLLGIAQCSNENTIIASLDKDLRMIPGKHFSWEIRGKSKGTSWVKEAELIEVSEEEGYRHFYTQCIIGDTADNVKGIHKAGPKAAEKILAECETEQDMFDAVREAYGFDEAFLMTARCLWIFRKPNDDFIHHFERLTCLDG